MISGLKKIILLLMAAFLCFCDICPVMATGAEKPIVIVLDPGHDAVHSGASGNGLKEEVLNLKIAQYCLEELRT